MRRFQLRNTSSVYGVKKFTSLSLLPHILHDRFNQTISFDTLNRVSSLTDAKIELRNIFHL